MTKSFVFRLTLGVAFVIVFATSVALTAGGWLLPRQYFREMDRWLTEESQQIATMIQTAKPGLTQAETIDYIKSKTTNIGDHTLYFIQIGNADGDILYRSSNLGTAHLPPNPGRASHWIANLPSISNMRITEAATGTWRVRVGLPMSNLDTILDSYIPVSLVLLAATAIGSLIIGYAFSRFVLAPLHAIEESARRIRSHNLYDRVYVPKNNRELASLATEINRGLDDVEAAFAQIRRFTADASHELKTPLTLIALNAEKLHKNLSGATAAPTHESEALLSNIFEETDSMKRIIDSLLFIARVDAGAITFDTTPHDIHTFIKEFSEDARILAEDKNLRIEVRRNAPGTPAFGTNTMRQLLLNLTSNAIAVTPPGGTITIDSEPTPQGGWRLGITDEGPGLPEDALENIFKRFWRYQPATISTLTTKLLPPGHGLGLAICRSIATLHGGTIRAENRADRTGLRIIFEWPARPLRATIPANPPP